MNNFITRGTLSQADVAHRCKENRRENYINHAEDTPCFNHDYSASSELVLLAEKIISDCYCQEKSSKEILRNFFIGIKKLREGL